MTGAAALLILLSACAQALAGPQAQQRTAAQDAATAVQSCRYGAELYQAGKTTRGQFTALLTDMQQEVTSIQSTLTLREADSGRTARNRETLLQRIGAAQLAITRTREQLAGHGAGGSAATTAQLEAAAAGLLQWEPQ